LASQFVYQHPAVWILVFIVLAPVGLALWFPSSAEDRVTPEYRSKWVTHRIRVRLAAYCTLAAWCAAWDIFFSANPGESLIRTSRNLWYCLPPLLAIVIVRFTGYRDSAAIFGERWRGSDWIKLTFYSTLSPYAGILILVVAFHDFYVRSLLGIVWLIVAGAATLAGAIGLRLAEGFKTRKVKSGALYKRASVLARQMKIKLEEISIVPAGRGNLTNGFSYSTGIALSDNYGKFLTEAELDSVILHELAHIKMRHGRRRFIVMGVVIGAMVVASFLLPPGFFHRFQPACDIFVVFAPTLMNCLVSRRFEYEADRIEVQHSHRPEVAIRSLANMHAATQSPLDYNWFLELFMTHPSFTRRAAAMRRVLTNLG
jgi:Zn-dependent protease with chaperone function